MSGWKRPPLPEGPLRDLNVELHRLHVLAGECSSYHVEAWLKKRAASSEFSDEWQTPSHTSIHRVLTRPELPRRTRMISVVEAFLAIGRSDNGRKYLDHVLQLWDLAFQAESASVPAVDGLAEPGEAGAAVAEPGDSAEEQVDLFSENVHASASLAAQRRAIGGWFLRGRRAASAPETVQDDAGELSSTPTLEDPQSAASPEQPFTAFAPRRHPTGGDGGAEVAPHAGEPLPAQKTVTQLLAEYDGRQGSKPLPVQPAKLTLTPRPPRQPSPPPELPPQKTVAELLLENGVADLASAGSGRRAARLLAARAEQIKLPADWVREASTRAERALQRARKHRSEQQFAAAEQAFHDAIIDGDPHTALSELTAMWREQGEEEKLAAIPESTTMGVPGGKLTRRAYFLLGRQPGPTNTAAARIVLNRAIDENHSYAATLIRARLDAQQKLPYEVTDDAPDSVASDGADQEAAPA